jgi:hypothetical protein
MFVQFALEPIWKVRSCWLSIRHVHTGHTRLPLAVPPCLAACVRCYVDTTCCCSAQQQCAASCAGSAYAAADLSPPLPGPGVHSM